MVMRVTCRPEVRATCFQEEGSLHTAYKILENVSVDTLCPRDPCRCQVDACYQLRRSSGSVDPAKDVRTGCPDTPSDDFVSHDSRD